MAKYIKTEDGYKNPKSLELSKFTNDLYGNQLILSLAGTPSGDEIEESYKDSRATYFDQYIGFNSEKLDNFDLRDTDFLCTLKLGNQIFTFSRDNTSLSSESADEYDLEYGSWDEEDWNFSNGASPLYCLEIDLYKSDEEPYYWLNIYGHVNDSVADSISFTYDIIEREPKKIPKEYLEITKLSDLDNDLYGCDEYVSLAQITDDQWEDEAGLHRPEDETGYWMGVKPCFTWGETPLTEVAVRHKCSEALDLSQLDFLVTMKVGDETVKFLTSDFVVSQHTSTDFTGDYGFEQGDIHADNSFDISAALAKPICQLWLRLYSMNNSTNVSIEAHTNNPNTFITFDFIKKQTKKIPEDYLNLSNIQSAVDAAQATADEAKTTADKSYEITRQIGTGIEIQNPSTNLGTLTVDGFYGYNHKFYAPYWYLMPGKLRGQRVNYTVIDEESGTTYTREFIITKDNSIFQNKAVYVYCTDLDIPIFIYHAMTSGDFYLYRNYNALGQLVICNFVTYDLTDGVLPYKGIFGYDPHGKLPFSMEYSLDGNAVFPNSIYAQNVYVGANKDEDSKKLATEEYIDNAVVNKVTAPTTATIGQTIRVSEVDNTGKPTAWEAVDFPEGDIVNTGRVLAKVSFTEEATGVTVTDLNADITELTVVFKATTGVYAPTFSVNNHKFKCYTGSWDGQNCYVFVRIDKKAGKILLKYKAANGGVQSNEQTWNENEIVESVGIDALGFAANDYFNVYEGLNALLLKETYIWLP